MKYYKKMIIRLLKKIDSEKFLRRIYISLRDYVGENECAKEEYRNIIMELLDALDAKDLNSTHYFILGLMDAKKGGAE